MAAPRIHGIVHRGPGELLVLFEDGGVCALRASEEGRKGGVFAPLADPEVFGQAEISPYGLALVFPGEVDYCADYLYHRAQLQAARQLRFKPSHAAHRRTETEPRAGHQPANALKR
jgi:hypothetical protein